MNGIVHNPLHTGYEQELIAVGSKRLPFASISPKDIMEMTDEQYRVNLSSALVSCLMHVHESAQEKEETG